MSEFRFSFGRTIGALALATTVSGCMSAKSQCYVTLDPGGSPTAEACETGKHLVVRPITQTNAAFYVPPYVIGALRYEGFLDSVIEEDRERGTDIVSPDYTAAYKQKRSADPRTAPVLDESRDTHDWRGKTSPSPRILPEEQIEARIDVPGGAKRLKPPHTIDGEVRYAKPAGIGMDAFPLSSDLLL